MRNALGLGGTHVVVLPFRNFGMLGVFIVQAFWAYFLNKFEKNTQNNNTIVRVTFLTGVIMSAPHWLWYGEKIIINTIIIVGILLFFKE